LIGKNVHEELQKICTANIKKEVGKCTYTQMLNEDGGIETDLTAVCLKEDHYRIITAAANREHDKFHIEKYLSKNIKISDVTDNYCVLGVFGPKSRDLMKDISSDDYSNENFKFATAKYIKINEIKVWAQRLSYVGELGYELYIEKDNAKEVYGLIINKGKKYKLSLCGMHAMDIMRMESGFLHWGHDISPEENQYEAGLNFTISYKKNIDFVGKQALLKIKEKKQKKKFIMLILKDSKPGEPLILHDEPIYLDGKIIGRTTSGNYSFNFNKSLAFGYVKIDEDINSLKNKLVQIEIEKNKYEVEILNKSLNQKDYKNS